jgi:adenosylcobinamide kinase / adenosylcobinamide-phosphate guanylyltransferase
MVTNEVGAGIVPEYPLGRVFRDWAGMMNQQIAELCDQVFLVTAGIPLELKRYAFRF